MKDELTLAIVVIVFATWIALALRQWWHRGEAQGYVSEESVGTAAGCEVYIASTAGRRYVELVITHSDSDSDIELHTYLTPSQARLMAGWMHLAATPGRTLADAKRRSRKAPA
jgi:hypothetical protein